MHDLEVDLRTAQKLEAFLGVPHQPGPKATSAIVREHRQRVNPAAVSVVSGHDAAHDLSSGLRYKEKPVAHGKLLVDREVRRVVRRAISEDALPQFKSSGPAGD